MEKWEPEMGRLEGVIRQTDGDGLRARWESGRFMLTLKKGKQLPRGVLDALTTKLNVSRAELTARMKFATTFSTDEELANAVRKFRTWHEIVQNGLTTNPRVEETDEGEGEDQEEEDAANKCDQSRQLRRVLAVVEDIDPATLDEGDLELLAQIAEGVRRVQSAVVSLMKVAS